MGKFRVSRSSFVLNFEWLGRDVEAAYIFKMVAMGLVVFFLIAITFGLI